MHSLPNTSDHWSNICGINIAELEKYVNALTSKHVIKLFSILKYFLIKKNIFLHKRSPTPPHLNFYSSPPLFPSITLNFLLFFKNKIPPHSFSFFLWNNPSYTFFFLIFQSTLLFATNKNSAINFFFQTRFFSISCSFLFQKLISLFVLVWFKEKVWYALI